jgi:hypothetical protein
LLFEMQAYQKCAQLADIIASEDSKLYSVFAPQVCRCWQWRWNKPTSCLVLIVHLVWVGIANS